MAKLQITSIEFTSPAGEYIRSGSSRSTSWIAAAPEWKEWSAYLTASAVEFHQDKDGNGQPLYDKPVNVVIVPRERCRIRGVAPAVPNPKQKE